jgi:hypothetical protein
MAAELWHGKQHTTDFVVYERAVPLPGSIFRIRRGAIRYDVIAAMIALERFRAYVEGMARPTITGVGSGEKLKVVWPGAGFDNRGPREDRAEVLPMMALLFPDAMTAR